MGGQHHSIQMFLLQPFSPESLKCRIVGGGGLVIQPSQILLCESAHQAFAGGQLSAQGHDTAVVCLPQMGGSPGKPAPSFSVSTYFHVLTDKMVLLINGTALGTC